MIHVLLIFFQEHITYPTVEIIMVDISVYSPAAKWRLCFFIFVFLPLKYLQRIGKWLIKVFWQNGRIKHHNSDHTGNGASKNGSLDATDVLKADEPKTPSLYRRECFETRRIVFECFLRASLSETVVEDRTFHVGSESVTAEKYVWKRENVFIHHVSSEGVTFVRTGPGKDVL